MNLLVRPKGKFLSFLAHIEPGLISADILRKPSVTRETSRTGKMDQDEKT